MQPDIPYVEGLLTAPQVVETAASIAAMQEPDGAVPWTVGEHTDVWNHIESAMALLVGRPGARIGPGLPVVPRHPARGRLVADEDRRRRDRGPQRRDQHVGVPRGRRLAQLAGPPRLRLRPPALAGGAPRARLGGRACSCPGAGSRGRRSGPTGARRRVNREALLAGSSSIYHALRAGVALAELIDDPQPEWELAGGRLGHALREHRDLFLDKCTFSMDWYYPVLGGAVRGYAGQRLLEDRWDEFVVPGLGIRCVDTNPWVTGAETCELVMALDALGDRDRALRLFADMQHLRDTEGRYWTGYVYPDDVNWPVEHTTYTAAAVILAADALGHGTRRLRHHARRDPAGRLHRVRPRVRLPVSRRGLRPRPPSVASTRIDPSASTSVERAAVERPQVHVVRRPPAVGGVGEHVVDDQQPAGHQPAAPSRRSRSGRAPRRGRRR